jgi:hypothetical protein
VAALQAIRGEFAVDAFELGPATSAVFDEFEVLLDVFDPVLPALFAAFWTVVTLNRIALWGREIFIADVTPGGLDINLVGSVGILCVLSA